MKTPIQAAQDLLHVMTEVGQAECYLSDMKLVIEGLRQAHRKGWEQAKEQIIAEWELPWGLSGGKRFEDRMRSMEYGEKANE